MDPPYAEDPDRHVRKRYTTGYVGPMLLAEFPPKLGRNPSTATVGFRGHLTGRPITPSQTPIRSTSIQIPNKFGRRGTSNCARNPAARTAHARSGPSRRAYSTPPTGSIGSIQRLVTPGSSGTATSDQRSAPVGAAVEGTMPPRQTNGLGLRNVLRQDSRMLIPGPGLIRSATAPSRRAFRGDPERFRAKRRRCSAGVERSFPGISVVEPGFGGGGRESGLGRLADGWARVDGVRACDTSVW